jgi:hypothetical protein
MKSTLPLVSLLALSAAASPSLRLAEATKPDWRGEAGLVFAADSATVAIEADGPATPAAAVRRSPDGPWTDAPLAPDGPNRWLLSLPEPGWYDFRVSTQNLKAAEGGDLTFTVAVLGSPIPEEWRTNSVFGIWNVHGDPALIRLAGARWNRRMTSFRDVTPDDAANYGDIGMQNAECKMQNAENSSLVTRHSSLAEGVASPYTERDGLAQVGVFSFGMPLWTMDMPEGVKLPSFGNPFYPAKDWTDVSRAVAAYASTHALPRDMSIYNEPLAHFKGKPAQIADYARAVRAGLKAADPSFRIGGPGLYSIRIRDLTAIEEGGLLESLDFLDMHAYVGGTPPEGEFVRKIEMLRDWLAAHGRADMPVYLTEFGWTAAEGTWQPPVDRATQARYVARSLALAWSQGIDALVYFALDFKHKKAGEAAFSLIGPDGRPEAGYSAFAAISRHFAASEPIGHFVLAPGVHMVAGRRDNRLQLMVWSEEETPPSDVAIPFEIESARDLFGSPTEPAVEDSIAKAFRMYPHGAVPERLHSESVAHHAALYAVSSSPFFLETKRRPTPYEIRVLPAKTAMSLPEFFHHDPPASQFWAVGRYSAWLKSPETDLPPAPTPADGTYLAFLSERSGQGHFRVSFQPYELVSPVTVESAEIRWPANAERPIAAVTLHSNDAEKPLEIGIGIGGENGAAVTLSPQERREIALPIPAPKPGLIDIVGSIGNLRIEMPDGSCLSKTFDARILAIWPENSPPRTRDFPSPVWTSFGPVASHLEQTGERPVVMSDCRAILQLFHSPEALLVEVMADDDEHVPPDPADPSRLWAQDSIQLGFDMDPLKPWEAGFAGAENSQTLGGHRVFELSVADVGGGRGIAYLERSWDDALPAGTVRTAIETRVERDAAAATTRYRIRIPWAELGAAESPPRPGDAIGVSIAVNDVDSARGAPRHGLTLFGGIVDDKEPRKFGRAWLRP